MDVVLSFLDLKLSRGNVVLSPLSLRDINNALDDFKDFKKSRYVEFMTSSGTSR
jgi:hypothetical protein